MNAPVVPRGACPSLSTPMQTGDGLLVRLNPVEGGLSPLQLEGLASAANRYGNGLIEVTQRGSLQIRGLTETSVLALSAEVDGLEIAVRTGLPIDINPLPGSDPSAIADPRLLASGIRAAVDEMGLAGKLGPKVSVVVDGGGRFHLRHVLADIRVEAVRQGDAVFWRLSIARDQNGLVPVAVLSDDETPVAAVELLQRIAALGRRARARDLPPASSGAVPNARPHRSPAPRLGHFVTGKGHALAIAIPFGSTSASRMTGLAHAANDAGCADIRLAPQHTLIALCNAPAGVEAIKRAAAGLDFIVDDSDPRNRILACAGSPACASGHIAARAIAKRLEMPVPAIDIHVSGCAKGCAAPGHEGLTFVGHADGLALHAQGLRGEPIANVGASNAEAAIKRVIALANRQEITNAALAHAFRGNHS